MNEVRRDLAADLNKWQGIVFPYEDDKDRVFNLADEIIPHAIRRAIEAERELKEAKAEVLRLQRLNQLAESARGDAEAERERLKAEAAAMREALEFYSGTNPVRNGLYEHGRLAQATLDSTTAGADLLKRLEKAECVTKKLYEALKWLKAISFSHEDDLEQWPAKATQDEINEALAAYDGKVAND